MTWSALIIRQWNKNWQHVWRLDSSHEILSLIFWNVSETFDTDKCKAELSRCFKWSIFETRTENFDLVADICLKDISEFYQ